MDFAGNRKTIHFLSDGASTQYRKMFLLMVNFISQELQVEELCWHYSEKRYGEPPKRRLHYEDVDSSSSDEDRNTHPRKRLHFADVYSSSFNEDENAQLALRLQDNKRFLVTEDDHSFLRERSLQSSSDQNIVPEDSLSVPSERQNIFPRQSVPVEFNENSCHNITNCNENDYVVVKFCSKKSLSITSVY
ncbi:unnamed protein product [Psylliodes chrysocephalus]|uniref:Uncharacterized protein n=1 Tax=Psylliodes chrysocephalus TaxID=3402493 RepID=A0A9P0CEI4_9CUCU|nr:unnamed protein product [Psylliodes chrysocephala]